MWLLRQLPLEDTVLVERLLVAREWQKVKASWALLLLLFLLLLLVVVVVVVAKVNLTLLLLLLLLCRLPQSLPSQSRLARSCSSK
jgi:hypothetical protein